MTEKIIIQVPEERLAALEAGQNQIIDALRQFKAVPPQEYLTVAEFMEACKISRWTFNLLREKNKIKVIQKSRKLYVPATEVNKFFTTN